MAAYTGDSTLLAFFASNVGNKVEVIGSRSFYHGLYELNVDSAKYLDASTVPAAVNIDADAFTGLAQYQGQWVELTGLTVSNVGTDTHGNPVITLMRVSDGTTIQVKWDNRVTITSNELTSLAVGDKVDITAILGWYDGPLLYYTEDTVITQDTPETDAALLAADAMLFDSPVTLDGDYTLPTLDFSTVSNVVVSSELTSYVANTVVSGALAVTRPAASDVSGTVTFTLSRGTDTLDVVVNVTVSQASTITTVTASYTDTSTTTNMEASPANNATLVNLDPAIFTVTSDIGSASVDIGLNKAGQIRLYGERNSGDGNTLTVAIASGYVITDVSITFGSSTYTPTAVYTLGTATSNLAAADLTNNTITDDSLSITSFSLHNNTTGGTSNAQIYVLSITITYDVVS
jgi:hypothetical protein